MKAVRRCVVRAAIGIVLALACFGAGAAQAELELGITNQYVRYSEPDIHETGVLYGLTGELSYRWENNWGIGGRAEVIGGGLRYDGQTWDGVPLSTDTDDVILHGGFLVGRYLAWRSVEAFAYTGLGTRYWKQDIEGAGGYEREVTWYYLPVGVRLRGAMTALPGWNWIAAMEFRTLLHGTVKSHLSDVDSRFNDPKTDVDRGYGAYLSVGAVYGFVDGGIISAVAITPYLEIWEIDASDTAALTFNGEPVTRVYEPHNDTTIYGVKISVRF